MDVLVIALGPAFAAGFAVQRLVEIIDSVSGVWGSGADAPTWKKPLLAIASFVVGLLLAVTVDLRVLEPLGIDDAALADVFVTGLVVSAGTEGFNSIMKFLGYKKEEQKAETAQVKSVAPDEGMRNLQSQV